MSSVAAGMFVKTLWEGEHWHLKLILEFFFMHALRSFTEHVIVDGNDLLLSCTCSFLRLLQCKVVLLHSIGGPYRGIEKKEIFIQCVPGIIEILRSGI